MTLTKAQRKKLAGEHKAVHVEVTNNWVCKHDRLLWPCPTAKVLWEIQQAERVRDYAKGKSKSA